MQKRKMTEIKEIIENIESDDTYNFENILHELLKVAVSIAGRGEIGDDYTKTIEFPIGDATIVSDPYYGRIWINTDDGEEEIEDDMEIEAISKDLKKRLLQFDKQIKVTREKIAREIFDKPLMRQKND